MDWRWSVGFGFDSVRAARGWCRVGRGRSGSLVGGELKAAATGPWVAAVEWARRVGRAGSIERVDSAAGAKARLAARAASVARAGRAGPVARVDSGVSASGRLVAGVAWAVSAGRGLWWLPAGELKARG